MALWRLIWNSQHSNSDAVIAFKSFISPSRLAISWFNSSVLYEG